MSSAVDVASAIAARRSFILTSHARPDGDAIGSQLALAFALDRLGKTVRLVDRDPVPLAYRPFPGTSRVEIAARAEGDADAVIVLECSDLSRPDVAGLDRYFVINVDHHLGNGMYGDINWFDASAAACGEMVADIIDALDVAWTPEIAAHLYLALATDTGSFRYGPLSARTFEICRRIVETGVDPAALSRQIFDSFSIGRVKLMGAMLGAMTLHHGHRLAVLSFDDALLEATGAAVDDTEGLVNLPLGAREVLSAVLIKFYSGDSVPGSQPGRTARVSLRSKGDVDVRAIATRFGGGGHKNAAGCTMQGTVEEIRARLVDAVGEQLATDAPALATTGVATGLRNLQE
jgi:bifunctional oligoribonuclease and PAP phosphatase NrnA